MPSTSPVYRAALRIARTLLPVVAPFDAKIRRGHLGRAGAASRLVAWGREGRDRARPLVWFHAPSVGEGLQAESVIRQIRARHPEWQVAYTHFSPSAEGLAARIGASVADYLPYDTPTAAEAVLDALAPSVLVFSKLDLWPELATRAARRGVRVALVAATVRPGSGRLRWPSRPLLAPGYRALAAAGAIDHPDAERLALLGVRREVIRITGDPRFDSVVEKVAAVSAGDPLLRFGAGAPTLVAGSTWPGDEAVLLGAFLKVRARHPEARLIVVPHDPSPAHLEGVEATAQRLGLPTPVRLGHAVGPAPLLLVDRVGVLAALYGAGTMAYVGGGFHSAGLHSVLEPAAWGLPVLFGPRWEESRDATLLAGVGAGVPLPATGGTDTLAERWLEWLGNESSRAEAGRRARQVIEQGLGAAAATASVVEELVRSEK